MRKQWIFVAVAVAVLTAGAVIGTRLAPQLNLVEVGARAPDFRAVDLGRGESVDFAAYRGQVVLLNIWATWCEPCKVEMPAMQRLHTALAPEGLKVVAVSIDESDSSAVNAFMRSYGLTFTSLQDRSRAIERIYQTIGVPESFVINRQGRIVKKVVGPLEWDSPANQELMRRLLAQRG